MTKATTTQTFDADKAQSIEYSAMLGYGTRNPHRYAEAFRAAQATGIAISAPLCEAVEEVTDILRRVNHLVYDRPRLTWEDATAEDMERRVLDAIMIDEAQQKQGTSAQREIQAEASRHYFSAASEAAPEVVNALADYIKKHSDMRGVSRVLDQLPLALKGSAQNWVDAVTAHERLLIATDPAGWDALERNDAAHVIYGWTDEQWLEYHSENDTLVLSGGISDEGFVYFSDWYKLPEVAIEPARSVAEVGKRTKHFNDLADDYNQKHRIKGGFNRAGQIIA